MLYWTAVSTVPSTVSTSVARLSASVPLSGWHNWNRELSPGQPACTQTVQCGTEGEKVDLVPGLLHELCQPGDETLPAARPRPVQRLQHNLQPTNIMDTWGLNRPTCRYSKKFCLAWTGPEEATAPVTR